VKGKAHLWEVTDFAAERLKTLSGPSLDPSETPLDEGHFATLKGLAETTTDKTGTVSNRTTEPIQDTFPEMSIAQTPFPKSRKVILICPLQTL